MFDLPFHHDGRGRYPASLTVGIPLHLRRQLKQLASASERSVASVVRDIITAGLASVPSQATEARDAR